MQQKKDLQDSTESALDVGIRSLPPIATGNCFSRLNNSVPYLVHQAVEQAAQLLLKLKGERTSHTPIHGDTLDWCGSLHSLPARNLLSGPSVYPGHPGWQVDQAGGSALIDHRRDQEVGAEHKLVGQVGSGGVGWEIVDQRAHGRRAALMGGLIKHAQVGPELLAQQQQLADDRIGRVAEGPHLVVSAA